MTDLRAFTATSSPRRSDGERSRHQAWGRHRPWEHRHPHPAVRGVADDGSDLVISRDSISHGPRSRAVDLVSSELRSKPEHEIRSALAREVEAEGWTRLDAAIRMAADESASSMDTPGVRRHRLTCGGRATLCDAGRPPSSWVSVAVVAEAVPSRAESLVGSSCEEFQRAKLVGSPSESGPIVDRCAFFSLGPKGGERPRRVPIGQRRQCCGRQICGWFQLRWDRQEGKSAPHHLSSASLPGR
jgi:hypothetical protein